MGVFSKIITAVRGGIREVGETIVDANGIRIMEQEMKDAEESLEKARRDLTDVMAQEMQAKRRIETLKAEIVKHEGYAEGALEKGDEALATEVAEKIVELSSEQEQQVALEAKLSKHVVHLKGMIKTTSKSLVDMRRQVSMVKTTDSVQKATVAITNNFATGKSKLYTAKESLERIKKRQEHLDDKLAAGEELQNEEDGKDLSDKLKAAGITGPSSSAEDILAKIKAKKKKASS